MTTKKRAASIGKPLMYKDIGMLYLVQGLSEVTKLGATLPSLRKAEAELRKLGCDTKLLSSWIDSQDTKGKPGAVKEGEERVYRLRKPKIGSAWVGVPVSIFGLTELGDVRVKFEKDVICIYPGEKKPGAVVRAVPPQVSAPTFSRAPRPVICVETGKRYALAREAAEAVGVSRSHVNACCRTGMAAGGLHWRFADDVPPVMPKAVDKISRAARPIVCVETGKSYPSINAAGEDVGSSSSNIAACASGKRKSAGGFTWAYGETK